MALLQSEHFQVVNKNINSKQSITDAQCFYSDVNGETIFQINTVGSSNREFVGKISQTVQLDKDVARTLIKALSQAFNFPCQL